MAEYLDEIAALRLGTRLIGFTGGEPFMNPELPAMLEDALSRGLRALVLTNAMKPMHKMQAGAAAAARALWRPADDPRLDRPLRPRRARGGARRRSWQPTIDGLEWLADNGFSLNVASR